MHNTPVTYAEAITMCLRVLGYANVIDARGTWPTNYIAKAQELKLMDDIEFTSYNDGAKRGDIALLIWNMLRTDMWSIVGESEGDGLEFAKGKEMLNVKFKDYTYSEEDKFESWSYNEDEEKVYVTLEDAGQLEYDKNDFYTLVPGTEVSVLYKNTKKDDVLLSIVPTEDNVLVDGSAKDLDEKYTNYALADGTTYSYLLLASNKKSSEVSGEVDFNGTNSEYVLKVEEKSNYTRVKTRVKTTVTTRSIKDEAKSDDLVLFGDERLSLADLKVGDVITKIAEHVFVLSRETVEGTFNSLTYEEDSEEDRSFIELDKAEYDVIPANLTIAKVNEKDEEVFDDVDISAVTKKKSDYIGEDATLYINFLGEVVRMEFGVVKASDVKGDFFMAPTGSIWSIADEDGATWYVKLANEDGEKSYVFADGKEKTVTFDAGECYWVVFNDDDEITEATEVANVATNALEDFTMAQITKAIDKDTKYIGDKKVTDSTKVFTVRAVEDEDGTPRVDKFELTVTEGYKALEGITTGTLALKKDSKKVAYAFVEGESTSDDKDFGIVEKVTIKEEKYYITVNGTKYEAVGMTGNNRPAQGSIIAYTLDSKDRIKVAFEYKVNELVNAAKVTEIDDSIVSFSNHADVDLDLLPDSKEYEDYRVFNIVVSYDDGKPTFDSIEEGKIDSIVVKKDYGMAENARMKVIAVIDGIEWPEETTEPTDPTV